jgi:cyclophilin family peptidyl-prolyl cis-trans isomerase
LTTRRDGALDMRPSPLLVLALAAAGCLQPAAAAEVHFAGLRIDTALGSIVAIEYANETPATAAFIDQLVDAHDYDGRSFGRTIPGFVIQEVDRTGGTTDPPGHVKLEAATNVSFSAGAFGIARDADPDSGGSEFFVMDFAYAPLDGNYTAFAQTVRGLDVVHAIAREPAVRTGPASMVASPAGFPVVFGVHDRIPVAPVVMQRVTRTDVALPADVAARYPLRISPTTSTPTLRATLEWPADLRAGHASPLTWYVATRDPNATGSLEDPPPADLSGAVAVVGGETMPLSLDAQAPGIAGFTWTPPAAGSFDVRLEQGGSTLAEATVPVAAS